jgi:hypothetical protein
VAVTLPVFGASLGAATSGSGLLFAGADGAVTTDGVDGAAAGVTTDGAVGAAAGDTTDGADGAAAGDTTDGVTTDCVTTAGAGVDAFFNL